MMDWADRMMDVTINLVALFLLLAVAASTAMGLIMLVKFFLTVI